MLSKFDSVLGLMTRENWKYYVKTLTDTVSPWCLGMAMASVGLSTNLQTLKGVGPKPFVAGFAGAGVVGMVGFTMAKAIGPQLHANSHQVQSVEKPVQQADAA